MTKKIYLETLKNALGRFILQYYIVSTLCEVENPKSDFVSFSTSDQRSTTLKQRWSGVEILAGILLFFTVADWDTMGHVIAQTRDQGF